MISQAKHSSGHFYLKPEAEFTTTNTFETQDCFQVYGDYQWLPVISLDYQRFLLITVITGHDFYMPALTV